MRKLGLLFLCLCLVPSAAYAQGAAPALFGVREIVIDPASFADTKSADNCNLTREKIANALVFAFKNANLPVTLAADAKPLSLGVARINLVPEISTYADENLDCVSWVSLSARNKVNAVIPPVSTLRTVSVVYWRQDVRVISGVSTHDQRLTDTLQKMAAQFAQQYNIDQPPELK
jgi:hypothetical protein